MASSRSTNTMGEFLQRILGDIAQAKALPDADLEFLVGLETQVVGKIREPIDTLMQGGGRVPFGPIQGVGPQGMGPGAPPGGPGGGAGGVPPGMEGMLGPAGPGGLPTGPPPGPPTGPMPGAGNLRQNPGMPSEDELRRLTA